MRRRRAGGEVERILARRPRREVVEFTTDPVFADRLGIPGFLLVYFPGRPYDWEVDGL